LLLVEKYRPKTFDEMIGFKEGMNLSHPFNIPHFIFYSKTPGTGKTSLGKVIVNELKADCLHLNASDDNSVDIIRDKVKRFVQTKSMNPKTPKIVFLDEADYLSNSAQAVLRGMLEQYHTTSRFILTCNYLNKIIEPIKSRCKVIEFKYPNKEEIKERLIFICENEKYIYEIGALDKIMKNNYPMIRNMINEIQHQYLTYKKIEEKNILKQDELFDKIYYMIKKNKIEEARKEWIGMGMNLESLLKHIYFSIIKDDIIFKKKREIIILLAETSYKMGIGSDKEIQFTAYMMRIGDKFDTL